MLKVILEDKFAFLPKKVKSYGNSTKWVWLKKYTELFVEGEKLWRNVNGCMIYKETTASHGCFTYELGHSENLKKVILEEVREKMEKVEVPKPKPQRSSYENVLISEEYYNKLINSDDIRDDTVYKIHKRNGPVQIIYVPTERAIFNVFGVDPGDLVLEEVSSKLYKVHKVDMVKGKDKQIVHVTYQYMSDGTRDTILF